MLDVDVAEDVELYVDVEDDVPVDVESVTDVVDEVEELDAVDPPPVTRRSLKPASMWYVPTPTYPEEKVVSETLISY